MSKSELNDEESNIASLGGSAMPSGDTDYAAHQADFSQPIRSADQRHYLDPACHELTNDTRENHEEKGKSKSLDLFCFHCNRPEWHTRAGYYRWRYLFLIGLTFGLVRFIGPFYCKCCGHSRWMWSDRVNLRYWLLKYQNRRDSRNVRRKSSRRRSR